MDKETCRMCGQLKKKSNLLKISDEVSSLIVYHCRILLQDNKTLPQKICSGCNHSVRNFARYCDNVKEVQARLLTHYELDVVEVKVEAIELPVIQCYYQELEQVATSSIWLQKDDLDVQEPTTDHKPCDLKNVKKSESEWSEQNNSSDSDYKSQTLRKYKKPLKKTEKRPVLKKTSKSKIKLSIAAEIDIAENDKNSDGTVTSIACSQYTGKKWCDMRMPCTECNQVIKGLYELKQHYKKYHSNNLMGTEKYQCEDCDGKIEHFHKFLNHVTDEHRPFLKFCCLVCTNIYWSLATLKKHYQSHSDGPIIHNCRICGRFFKEAFYLTSHETRFHKDETLGGDSQPYQTAFTMEKLFSEELSSKIINFEAEPAFKIPEKYKLPDGKVDEGFKNQFSTENWSNLSLQCSECQKDFSPYLLQEHYSLKHPSLKLRSFSCKTCPGQKPFLNLEPFVNHTFIIHREHLRYFCFICNEICLSYKLLFFHFKSMHTDYHVNICLYCGRHHKTVYDLKQHKEIHSIYYKELRVLQCDKCSRVFKQKSRLLQHLKTHNAFTSEQNAICETCGIRFKNKWALIAHNEVHQTEKPLVCGTCGEGFKNKYRFKAHQEIHTEVKKFACEICGKRFRGKAAMKCHLITHNGQRAFKCEFCEKAFHAKSDLLILTRLHTGEFTHECKICGERYPSWSNYSKHMRGRHKVDPRSEKKKKYDALHKSFSRDTSTTNNSTDATSLLQFN